MKIQTRARMIVFLRVTAFVVLFACEAAGELKAEEASVNWTGIYGSAFIGGSGLLTKTTDIDGYYSVFSSTSPAQSQFTRSGFAYGSKLDLLYQYSRIVTGVSLEAGSLNVRGGYSPTLPSTSSGSFRLNASAQAFASLSLVGGFLVTPELLIDTRVGFGYAQMNFGESGGVIAPGLIPAYAASFDKTQPFLSLGGDIRYRLSDRIFVELGYEHLNLKTINLQAPAAWSLGGYYRMPGRFGADVARLGIGYKFY